MEKLLIWTPQFQNADEGPDYSCLFTYVKLTFFSKSSCSLCFIIRWGSESEFWSLKNIKRKYRNIWQKISTQLLSTNISYYLMWKCDNNLKFFPPYQWTYYTYTYLLTLPQKIIEKGKIIYLFSLKNQVFTITITFLKRALTTPENLEKNRIKGSRYKSARAPLGGLSFTSNIFVYFWNSLMIMKNSPAELRKKCDWKKEKKKKTRENVFILIYT